LYFNAEASGATHMPLPDSRVLPLASPYANARDFPDIFLNPTCLYGGQCQGMFGTLDANGRATVTVQLPADGLTSLGPDLYLAAVTRNTAMPSGYEDISVGVHVQILGPPPCTSDAECDDGNPCTDDFCDAGSCSNPAYDCDDDDACTTDHCQDGWCISEPLVCNDNNACTIDSCNPATGCLNAALACNDGDTCTTDSCEPALGSVYTPIAGCITCRAIGQSCTANSDCCSGSCKGRTGLCN